MGRGCKRGNRRQKEWMEDTDKICGRDAKEEKKEGMEAIWCTKSIMGNEEEEKEGRRRKGKKRIRRKEE